MIRRVRSMFVKLLQRRSTAAERGDSSALVGAALESLGVAVCIQDVDFNIVFQNSRHRSLVGNHVGERCFEAFHRRSAPCEGCGMGPSLADGDVHVSRQSMSTTDGARSFEITTSPLVDRDGGLLGGIKLVVDVTERLRAEESLREATTHLRTLVDAIPDAIFFKDRDGRYILVNQAFSSVLGVSEADALGKTDYDLLDGDVAEKCRKGDRQVLEARKPVRSEHVVTGPAGSRTVLETLKVPLYDDRGDPTGLVAISHDVTNQKRVEEVLKTEAHRRDEFLAMLGHELRNPLAPIRNAAQVLKLIGPLDTRAEQARQIIERQVSHLSRIVDDLLDVSRIAKGKITLQRELLDWTEVVRAVVEDHRSGMTSKRIRLVVAVPGEPVWVDGDATRLAQALGNLLNNAQKFTEVGGTISVKLEADLLEKRATLTVGDDGIGMVPETLGHVFEPFIQAETDLARTREGMGLGLAIVKGFVELHHGTVRASSKGLGRGSELAVTLPLARAPAASASPPAEAGSRQGGRVLIIEDNADAADSLGMYFGLQGWLAETAGDGFSGLERARQFAPDVIVCDVGLPGMDGYEVARSLRADPSAKVPLLVALTGYGQEEDKKRARRAGFDVHLTKPVDPEALQQILQNAPR